MKTSFWFPLFQLSKMENWEKNRGKQDPKRGMANIATRWNLIKKGISTHADSYFCPRQFHSKKLL